MEVPNDGSEAIYEELDSNEASEDYGMSANQSYGGMASTSAEEGVHTPIYPCFRWHKGNWMLLCINCLCCAKSSMPSPFNPVVYGGSKGMVRVESNGGVKGHGE
jgi:hypothetical protein